MSTGKNKDMTFWSLTESVAKFIFVESSQTLKNRLYVGNNQTSKTYDWHYCQFKYNFRKMKSILSDISHQGIVHCKEWFFIQQI